MGSCVSNQKEDKRKSAEVKSKVQLITGDKRLTQFEKELFPDMPEWDGDRYRGIGIKRMKGYVCNLPINELNKLREEFWNVKSRRNIIWRKIKQACIMDEGIK
jgi:hypothetical protein